MDRPGRVLTSNLPLRAVLRPDTDSILLVRIADALVNLDKTGSEIVPSLSNLAISHPFEAVAPGLGRGIPLAASHALLVGSLAGGSLEKVVNRANFRIIGGQEISITKSPASVDGAATRTLGARKWYTIRRARWRDSAELQLERNRISSRSHGIDSRAGPSQDGM